MTVVRRREEAEGRDRDLKRLVLHGKVGFEECCL